MSIWGVTIVRLHNIQKIVLLDIIECNLKIKDRYGQRLRRPDEPQYPSYKTCSISDVTVDYDKENIAPRDYQALPSLHSRLRPHASPKCVVLRPVDEQYTQDSG